MKSRTGPAMRNEGLDATTTESLAEPHSECPTLLHAHTPAYRDKLITAARAM